MLIKAFNLAIGYDSQVVVDYLDFEINEGDYLCIIGENGSGKTTLFRTLLGLQKPLSGTIEFDSSLRKDEIGYLPQQKELSYGFPATVFEIVISGFQKRHTFFYSRKQKEIAKDNLRMMGMQGYENHSFWKLSGGQQQRVLLSRALCTARKILFLDEPAASLDPKASDEFYKLIEELNQSGMTIVMISHDRQAALRYASHILNIGNRLFFGTRKQFLDSERKFGV